MCCLINLSHQLHQPESQLSSASVIYNFTMVLTVITSKIINGIIEKYGPVKKLNLSSNGIEIVEDMHPLSSFLQSLNISSNHITDISFLSPLLEIVELDLHDNEISNLFPLLELTRLERLDVSYNHIEGMGGLQALCQLHHLRTLAIEGNPVCKQIESYMEILFSSIPDLESIDSITRSQHEESIRRPVNFRSRPPVDDTNPQESPNSDLVSKIAHLEALLMSMETAFSLQEKILGNAVAHHASTNVQLIGQVADHGALLNESNLKQVYTELLRSWRRKTLQSVVLRKSLEREYSALQFNLLSVQNDAKIKFQDYEMHLESQRHRSLTVMSENSDLRQQLVSKSTACIEAEQKSNQMQKSMNKQEQAMHVMRLFLEECRNQLDKNMVTLSQQVVKASRSLQNMDMRLSCATERVQLASSLFAQKKIRNRNSLAARTALSMGGASVSDQPWGNAPPESSAAAVTERGCFILNENDGVASLRNLPNSGGDSLAFLTPEAESLLRSLFRQLDPHDYGYISVELLLSCLTHRDQALLQLINCALGGGASDIRSVTSGNAVEHFSDVSGVIPVMTSWCERLLQNLHFLNDLRSEGSADTEASVLRFSGDLTWGEFLLLLSISSNSRMSNEEMREYLLHLVKQEGCFTSLSKAENVALQKRSLIGDHEWAMIPLRLDLSPYFDSESRVTDTAEKSRFDSGNLSGQNRINELLPPPWLQNAGVDPDSATRLKIEALRLSKERSFLLSRVQLMNRNLDRRVASVRDYFASDIKQSKLKELKLQTELEEHEQKVQSLSSRLQEEMSANRSTRQRLTDRITELEQENAKLKSQEDLAKSELEGVLKGQLEEQRTKFVRLESEHRLLKKESCKMDVTIKTSQRDLQRIQSMYTTESTMRKSVEDKYHELETRFNDMSAEKERLLEQFKLQSDEINSLRAEKVLKIDFEKEEIKPGVSEVAIPATCASLLKETNEESKFQNSNRPDGASAVAIDAFMHKLHVWNKKLSEIDGLP